MERQLTKEEKELIRWYVNKHISSPNHWYTNKKGNPSFLFYCYMGVSAFSVSYILYSL